MTRRLRGRRRLEALRIGSEEVRRWDPTPLLASEAAQAATNTPDTPTSATTTIAPRHRSITNTRPIRPSMVHPLSVASVEVEVPRGQAEGEEEEVVEEGW